MSLGRGRYGTRGSFLCRVVVVLAFLASTAAPSHLVHNGDNIQRLLERIFVGGGSLSQVGGKLPQETAVFLDKSGTRYTQGWLQPYKNDGHREHSDNWYRDIEDLNEVIILTF